MTEAKRIAKSLGHAWHGIAITVREERNFAIELVAGCLVVIVAFALGVSRAEAAVLALVVGGVLVLELMNSALERVVDLVKPRLSPFVAEIKDLSAAAVLVAAATAAVIAVIVFGPHVLALIG